MIELPGDQASGKATKPKGWLAQITTSSARRERWIAAIDAAAQNSSAKSRSDTASMLFVIGRSKPSACAVASRSSGKLVPASAAAPRGDSLRSEERRGGKEGVSTCRSRWSPVHTTKQIAHTLRDTNLNA